MPRRRRPRPGYAFEAPAAASEKPDASEEPAPPAPPPVRCARRRRREPAEAEEPAESSADDSADAFEKLADAFEEPGTPPPPRKTAQELAAALEAVSAQLEPAAAPEPKSPRPWSFKRTLHSPSRTPKRFFGSKPDDVEPKKLWEDGDASDAGDAPPRVSLEELDEFVDVVALNKRTGKRSIIRLARGTVMSDVFAAYAQHTKATRRSSSSSAATALRRGSPSRRRRASRTCGAPPPRGAPRGRRASGASPRSPSTSRSGTAPSRSATTPGTRSTSGRSTRVNRLRCRSIGRRSGPTSSTWSCRSTWATSRHLLETTPLRRCVR